jgi:Carboxypeptidase regulatory-like domain
MKFERAVFVRFCLSALAVLALALGGVSLRAQVLRGTINGHVTDKSGASVPGAQITVTNEQTGVAFKTVSTQTGVYVVPELQAGTYSIVATKEGFSRLDIHGVSLLSTETLRQDLTMQVGQLHQTVNVTAQVPLVHTESSSITTPINTRQLQELPQAIQDIDGLLFLAAGVGRPEFNSAPQIAGSTHWGGDNFTLNGVSVNDPGNGGGSYSYDLGGVNLPALSSLQEVRIGGVNMDARYSRVVNIAMVTKNGTNQIHGDVYEYLENTKLNASDFLLNLNNESKPPFHRNQFGGDVGGPILKNRAFFFFDYSAVRQSIPKTVQDNFPSLAMRGGDFSALCTGNGGTFKSTGVCSVLKQQLYNPYTGSPYPMNQIPVGSQPGDITPQAQEMLNFMPPPTVTDPSNSKSLGLPSGGPDYTAVVSQFIHVNKWDLRIDENLSQKDRLFGVYSYSVGDPWFDPLGQNPPTFGNGQNYGYKTFTLSATEIHTFGAQTVNSFRWAWFDHTGIRSGQNVNYNPYTLFPQFASSGNRGLPKATMTGYQAISDHGLGLPFPEYDVEITDDFTHVVGSHTLQAGMDETGFKVYSRGGLFTPLPAWGFTGTWTAGSGWPGTPTSAGNAFADFLIGTAATAGDGNPVLDKVLYDRDWQFYFQDVWQASHRLTLNFGLRYVYQTPWRTRDNQVSYYDPVNNKMALPQNSDTVTAPPGSVAPLLTSNPTWFETTQTAGLGFLPYKSDTNNFAPRVGFAWRPFASGHTVLRGGFGIYYNYIAAYVGMTQNSANIPWSATYSYSSGKPGKPTKAYLPDLTFAQPLPTGKTSVTGGANPTVHWVDQNYVNPRIKEWNVTLEHQFGNNWVGRATYVGNRTDHLTYYNYNINIPGVQTLGVALQKQRPYQPWGVLDAVNSGNYSSTDQLQLEAQHQFANGFFLQGEYSWTRCLDDGPPTGGPQNPSDPLADYGNCSFLRRHNLAVNYIYALPFGHGRHWLQQGVLSQVLGDWNVSGITTYMTGQPYSVSFAVPASITGWFGGRADIVPGVSPYIQDHSHEVGALWFNPDAFAPPAPGTWGNSPRNGYFAPGAANWDISVMKDFHMPYSEQHRLRVRADFFDAFNHYNFDNAPVATVADTRDGGSPNPNTGRIQGGGGNRVIQLSLKYDF